MRLRSSSFNWLDQNMEVLPKEQNCLLNNFHNFTTVDFINMSYFIYSKAPHRLVNIPVIEEFPCIWEFGHERYSNIRPSSLDLHLNSGIEICYVKKGRYDWQVENKEYVVYPGEGFITCPWEYHGNSLGVVELGEIYWLIITPEVFSKEVGCRLANWSSFSPAQEATIAKVLRENQNHLLNNCARLEKYFLQLNHELVTREFGFDVKIRSLIETILLEVVRIIQSRKLETNKNNVWINELRRMIESDFSKKWSIDEMSSQFNMGSTSFNDKVKKLTGYSPQSFLIDLKIEQSKKQLVETHKHLTDIALDTGFYSSQHFSATFLKRVGMTPSAYKKKNANGYLANQIR